MRRHPARPLRALLLVPFLLSLAAAQLDAGAALLEEGRFAEAADLLEAAAEARPDDAEAQLLAARAATLRAESLAGGADAGAREALLARAVSRASRAVELAPDDPRSHLELARALGRLAQLRGVLSAANLAARTKEALETAVAVDPSSAAGWHALARFHHEAPWIVGGRSDRVLPYFERAVERAPDDLPIRVDLAAVLLDRGRPDEARAQLDVAAGLPVRDREDREAAAAAEALRARLP